MFSICLLIHTNESSNELYVDKLRPHITKARKKRKEIEKANETKKLEHNCAYMAHANLHMALIHELMKCF